MTPLLRRLILTNLFLLILLYKPASAQQWARIDTTGKSYGNMIWLNHESIVSSTVIYSSFRIEKSTSSFDTVWRKSFGNSRAECHQIFTDGTSIYFAGIYRDSLQLDSFKFKSWGVGDAFLAKMDTFGNVLWAKSYGGKREEGGFHAQFDKSGRLFFTLLFTDSTVLGSSVFTPRGSLDYAWGELTLSGDVKWAKAGGSAGQDSYLNYFITDDDFIYHAINIRDDSLIINGNVLRPNTPFSSYLIKHSKDGDFKWVKKIISAATLSEVATITIDGQNNLILSTYSEGPATVFQHNISATTPTATLIKIDTAARVIFLKETNSKPNGTGCLTYITQVYTDSIDNIYSIGAYEGAPYVDTIKFGSNPGPHYNGMFITKHSTTGQFQWLQTGENDLLLTPRAIHVYPNKDIDILCDAVNQKYRFGCISLDYPNFHGGSTVRLRLTFNTPGLNLGSDTSLCLGDSLVLHIPTPGTYLWQDGSVLPNYTIKKAGKYYARLFNNGCASDTIRVKYDSLPVKRFGQDQTLCEGDSLILKGGKNYLYEWQNGSVDSIFMVRDSGSYILKQTNFCGISLDTINIDYTPKPFMYLGSDTSLCKGEIFTIKPAPLKNTEFTWSTGANTKEIFVSKEGLYWCKAQNQCGIYTDSLNITFLKPPSISLASSHNLCNADPLEVYFNNQATKYEWNDASTASFRFIKDTGDYWVIANNVCGSDSASIRVVREGCEKCAVYIPNAFSPNADGINDVFTVSSNCELSDFHITIYNRGAQTIFDSRSQYESWSGLDKVGGFAPSAVYFYTLKITFRNGVSQQYTGNITLIK